ncbi:MAG: hypothetical protein K2M00_07835 [Muribaculaceae bacterium]|nr:hypothetical protein [Muribaculaceae bacterium]
MGRRVVTLDNAALAEVCARLERNVMSSGFRPEAILSIATGGIKVGELMFNKVPHLTTKLQRPSTKTKKSFVKNIVKRLPRPVQDAMRVAEAGLLELAPTRPADASQVVLPPLEGLKRILVADDAVDSGATLAAVLKAVEQAAPEAIVMSAAITVTTRQPLVTPDFAIFNNLTLIRFPWSMDW